MGRNFYLETPSFADTIPELAIAADKVELFHGPEAAQLVREVGRKRLHIGKASAGWCFALHVFTEQDRLVDSSLPANLEDWIHGWFEHPNNQILTGDGMIMNTERMLTIICDRSNAVDHFDHAPPYGYHSWADFFHRNQAEPGPRGLVRAKIDHVRCIGHGDGPWDLIAGEFF